MAHIVKPVPSSHPVPGSGTPVTGPSVKVTTVSVDMSPAAIRTTAVSASASKLISRSSGKVETPTSTASSVGNSVIVAGPSGN